MKTPKPDPYRLRSKTDEEVCEWIAGYNDKQGIGHRLLGQHELQRRLARPEAVRSWIAIVIAGIAITLTVLQLAMSH